MPLSTSSFSRAYRLSPLLWGVILVFVLGMWTCGNAPVFGDLGIEVAGQYAASFDEKNTSKAQAPVAHELAWALGSLGSSEQVFALAESSTPAGKANKVSPQQFFAPDPAALAPWCAPLFPSETFETSPVRAASWRLPAARGLVHFAIPPPLKVFG